MSIVITLLEFEKFIISLPPWSYILISFSLVKIAIYYVLIDTYIISKSPKVIDHWFSVKMDLKTNVDWNSWFYSSSSSYCFDANIKPF